MSRSLESKLTVAICCYSSDQYDSALNTIESLLGYDIVLDIYTGEQTTKEIQELVRESFTGIDETNITFCSIPGDDIERINTAINECTTEYITFIDPGVIVAEVDLNSLRDRELYTGIIDDCNISEISYYNQLLPINLNGLIFSVDNKPKYTSKEELILKLSQEILEKTVDYCISWGKHHISFKLEDDRLIKPWEEELTINTYLNLWENLEEDFKTQTLQNYIWNRITTAAAAIISQDSDKIDEYLKFIYPAYKYKILNYENY